MKEYRISYVLTTYNKLPYLQQVLGRLIADRRADEEIVVCDGGSNDGTPAYLQELFDAGQIQQFVSERDKGESHGFNKGLLRAKGEILKLITDDDAFCYPAIREAAAFMLEHPEVDVLSGETWLLNVENLQSITFCQWSLDHYKQWQQHGTPGTMIGLPWLVRRTSLPLTGLFHPGIVQVDGEFAFRITSLGANIAWMSQLVSIRIENPQSNARNMGQEAIDAEVERMLYFYNYETQHNLLYYLRRKSALVRTLKKPLLPLKKLLQRLRRDESANTGAPKVATHFEPGAGADPLAEAFRLCDKFMVQYNGSRAVEFLLPQTANPATA